MTSSVNIDGTIYYKHPNGDGHWKYISQYTVSNTALKTAYPIYITNEFGRMYIDCTVVDKQLSKLVKDNERLKRTLAAYESELEHCERAQEVELRTLAIGDKFKFASSQDARVYIKLGTIGRMSSVNTHPKDACYYMQEGKSAFSYCSINLVVVPVQT